MFQSPPPFKVKGIIEEAVTMIDMSVLVPGAGEVTVDH